MNKEELLQMIHLGMVSRNALVCVVGVEGLSLFYLRESRP